MKQSIYTVRDNLAHSIGPLCLFDNDAVAKRAFRNMVNSSKDPILSRCPSDFEIVRLGDIDINVGTISAALVPVASAVEVLESHEA